MLNLFNAEFNRARKSKSLLVLFVIILVFNVLNVLFFSLVDIKTRGFELIASAFSFSNNSGFAIPIVLIVYMTQEFSNGTIRNKIIAGNSRHKIYLTNFLSCLIIGFIFVYINIIINFGLSYIYMSPERKIGSNDYILLLKILLLGTVNFASIFSIVTFIVLTFKQQGLGIIIYIAIVFGLLMSSIVYFINNDVVKFLFDCTPVGQLNILSNNTRLSLTEVFKGFVSLALFGGIPYLLGTYLFNKADIK